MQPNLNDITLPLLRILADGKVHRSKDLHKVIGRYLLLEGISQKVPIGLDNQVRQSRVCLEHACLIQRLSRRRCRISAMGQGVLRKNPQALNTYVVQPPPKAIIKKSQKIVHYLPYMEELKEKDSRLRGNDVCLSCKEPKSTSLANIPDVNPEDALRTNYQTLRQSLAADLLGKIKRVSPSFFEQLVVDVLVAMGYGGSRQDAAQILGRSGDGGVDGIIKEDQLGLDVIYIQAKRWENPVGRPEVQGFAGSLEGFRARKGVFMTTSRFTKEAREYVERISSRIILIDGQHLAELMLDHNVGSLDYERFVIKKLDLDYFDAD